MLVVALPSRRESRSYRARSTDQANALTFRSVAAQEFVLAFQALARDIGETPALCDPRVQAARQRYTLACPYLRRVA